MCATWCQSDFDGLWSSGLHAGYRSGLGKMFEILGSPVRNWSPTHEAIRLYVDLTLLPVHGDLFSCILQRNDTYTIERNSNPRPEYSRFSINLIIFPMKSQNDLVSVSVKNADLMVQEIHRPSCINGILHIMKYVLYI